MLTQPTLFDYTALDSETRIVVQQRTGEIKALMKRAAQDIIDIGQKLIEVKARLGHGQFGEWLRTEFEWDARTAQNFMRVGETFKSENFSLLSVAPSALYLLAAPSTPEAARVEVLERADAGEAITHKAAVAIVSEHRHAPAPALTTQPSDWWANDEPIDDDAIPFDPATDDDAPATPEEPAPRTPRSPTSCAGATCASAAVLPRWIRPLVFSTVCKHPSSRPRSALTAQTGDFIAARAYRYAFTSYHRSRVG